MKKTMLVLALLGSLSLNGAEVPAAPKSFLDGIYIEGLGVMRKPNFTGKGEYGAGAELGLWVNPKVAIGVQNIAYATPNHWRGGAIDETTGVAHWVLLSSSDKATYLEGLGTVTYGWEEDFWAIGAGVGLRHNFGKKVSAGVSGIVRFRSDEQKEDLMLTASLGFKF